jgi:hypothetical protein
VEGPTPEARLVFGSDWHAPLRVLVLRRHKLAWRPMQKGRAVADSDGVPLAMARWVLLALALGRRAVLPFVPCEIPRNVPALPPQLWETVIPFSNVSWCDAAAREPRAALPAAAALGWSAARADAAGNAARNERGERSACCLWVPPAACVDLVGRRVGGLRGELLLTEPDYGGEPDYAVPNLWLHQPAPLCYHRLQSHARSLQPYASQVSYFARPPARSAMI